MNTTDTKHTPGPWIINRASNGETTGIISAHNQLYHVADTFDSAYHNAIARGQVHPATEFLAAAQANARLIAASPELLHACKMAYEVIFRHSLEKGSGQHGTPIQVIAAAIAKAEVNV